MLLQLFIESAPVYPAQSDTAQFWVRGNSNKTSKSYRRDLSCCCNQEHSMHRKTASNNRQHILQTRISEQENSNDNSSWLSCPCDSCQCVCNRFPPPLPPSWFGAKNWHHFVHDDVKWNKVKFKSFLLCPLPALGKFLMTHNSTILWSFFFSFFHSMLSFHYFTRLSMHGKNYKKIAMWRTLREELEAAQSKEANSHAVVSHLVLSKKTTALLDFILVCLRRRHSSAFID